MIVSQPRVEYGAVPFSPTPRPRLSWKVETEARDWQQASYTVQLLGPDGGVANEVGVHSADSVFVPWPFDDLVPLRPHDVRVRVTSTSGLTSDWSAPTRVESAESPDAWPAAWLSLAAARERSQPARFRRTVVARDGVRRAVLHATAQGVYQVRINGTEIDDHRLKPGWTSYDLRTEVETTDVTALLAPGDNLVEVDVTGGWFTEEYGFLGNAHSWYGDQVAFTAFLDIEYHDADHERIVTDDSWDADSHGPIVSSGLYRGETFDARRDTSDSWTAPALRPVTEHLVSRSGPPVRAVSEAPVRSVTTTPRGSVILDFGQNLVGHLRIRLDSARDTEVTIRHAEVLEPDGTLSLRPLRYATSTDVYVSAGTGPVTWEPTGTFHGFRYAEIVGWPGVFDPDDVTAVVVGSEMARTGWFESSDPRLDRLHENVVWGMRGNFLSLPTDCPQRDERMGWTGDVQVFSPTAAFLYDCDGFLASWLEDLSAEQREAGGVAPYVVPRVLERARRPVAAWGDAATVVPSVLHERFGDRGLLRRQYPSMRDWVEVVLDRRDEEGLWTNDFQLGDWLDPAAPPEAPGRGRTDADLVASAYLVRSLRLTASAASELGETSDARKYEALADSTASAFVSRWVTERHLIVCDSPTAYSLAIVFGLARDRDEELAFGDRLAQLVRETGYTVSTGFVGTPIVCDALTSTGHLADAARLLFHTECPSWLYAVDMGATTVWERWDSMLPDGSINPGEMTSFNHYSLGSVADWMHRVLAGLNAQDPGYRSILVRPRPVPQLTHARVEFESPYGRVASGWRRSDRGIHVTARVAPGTTATIVLPDGSAAFRVGSGRHEWIVDEPAPTARGAVTLDTPLDVVIGDADAYSMVVAAVEEAAPADVSAFRRDTRWTARSVLAEALFMLGPEQRALVVRRLDGLSRERASSADAGRVGAESSEP